MVPNLVDERVKWRRVAVVPPRTPKAEQLALKKLNRPPVRERRKVVLL